MKIPTLLISILCSTAMLSQSFRTQTIDPQIKTLQVYPEHDITGFPLLELGSDHRLVVSFDDMVFSERTFYYKIVHCDRNWQRSLLGEMEYYDGFTINRIDDVDLSQNTLTNYTNYRFSIPREGDSFKVSGNYAVLISDDSSFDKVDAVVCLYVAERLVDISSKVTSGTLKGFNTHYQQLEVEVDNGAYPIQNPTSELNLSIIQNRRTDNAVRNLRPTFVSTSRQTYSNIGELVFEGGNEYRFIDFSDEYRYSGDIDKIDIKPDRYNVYTLPAVPRNRSYLPSNYGNANGRYIVNRKNYHDPDYNADYMQVHFVLPADMEYYGYDIYIVGDMFDNRLDDNSKMELDTMRNIFRKSVFLKQGGYSFLYLFVPHKASRSLPATPSLIPFEGSFWQTRNEYAILLYHTPFGAKYDRLIGFKIFNNQ